MYLLEFPLRGSGDRIIDYLSRQVGTDGRLSVRMCVLVVAGVSALLWTGIALLIYAI